MTDLDNKDWWIWKMYRYSAEFIHNPSMMEEQRLRFIMTSYRYFYEVEQQALSTQVPDAIHLMPQMENRAG